MRRVGWHIGHTAPGLLRISLLAKLRLSQPAPAGPLLDFIRNLYPGRAPCWRLLYELYFTDWPPGVYAARWQMGVFNLP